MIVTYLRIKNWRNFKSAEINLKNRAFLIGPNASGKSNLLDVFRFLRDISSEGGGFQKAISDRGGLKKIRYLNARNDPNVEIEVRLEEDGRKWQYILGIEQEQRGIHRPKIKFEKVKLNGELILNRPDEKDKKDIERMIQTSLEQINANEKFRDLNKYFSSIVYLHLVPQLLRYPEFFSGPVMPSDPFGRNFIDRIVKTPEKTRTSRLNKLANALKVAVPQFKKLEFHKDEMGIPHLRAIYEHWRPHGAYHQEKEFSDGTLRLIGLFWSLLESNSLLLLEEPELYLNSGIVSKLPGMMYRLQTSKKRQVLVSTHSADILSDQGIDGNEIFILEPQQEGTLISSASSIEEVKALLESGMSPSEAILPRVQPIGIEKLGDL